MSDTFSTTANTITAVGFCISLGCILFRFVSSIRDAPEEIHQLAAELEVLSVTFASIEAISRDLPSCNQFSGEFLDRLRSCTADFEGLEKNIRPLQKRLRQNRMRNFWIQAQWPLYKASTRRLINNVQSCHVAFPLGLAALQIQLGLGHQISLSSTQAVLSNFNTFQTQQALLNEKLSKGLRLLESQSTSFLSDTIPHSPAETLQIGLLDSATHSQITIGEVVASTVTDSIKAEIPYGHPSSTPEHIVTMQADSLNLAFWSHAQPVNIRATTIFRYGMKFIKLTFWRGPVFIQKWHKGQQPKFGPLSREQGYGIGVSLAFPYSRFSNATFTASFMRDLVVRGIGKAWRTPSLHWSLSFPAVVAKDSDIMEFALLGNLEGMLKLFQAGRAGPTDVAPDGDSLLHIAVEYNHLEVCRELLRAGANANAANGDGDTPLHSAISRTRNYDIVRLLMENGADPGNCNSESATVLHTYFNDAVGKMLLYYGEMVESDARDRRGMTPLHFVAWSSQSTVDAVRRQVERGNPSDVVLKDNEGRSALHLAVQRGNMAVIEYLMGLGAHVDARCRDRHGKTVLHYAVDSRRTETIIKMAEQGHDIRAKDFSGKTILHRAAWRGNLEAARLVIELGAAEDIRCRDEAGKTPLDLAIESKAMNVADFLKEFAARNGTNYQRDDDDGRLDTKSTQARRTQSTAPSESITTTSIARTINQFMWTFPAIILILLFFYISI
ncbi:MAG: hypothetical protein M1840_006243 [Geoglossum simile]|nr:MAG: hypothetical protein M1840_006243 [Geoglossum simile]